MKEHSAGQPSQWLAVSAGSVLPGVLGSNRFEPMRREMHYMPGTLKTLSLVKGRQHFCFRYEVGQEGKVLDAFIDMVNRRDLSFDWFDAAVLSHQLGQHLAKELKPLLPKKAA